MSITLMILLGLLLLLAFAPKKDGTPSAASAFVAPLVPAALAAGPTKSNRDIEDDQDIEALAEAYRAHQKGERAKAAIDKVASLAKKAS